LLESYKGNKNDHADATAATVANLGDILMASSTARNIKTGNDAIHRGQKCWAPPTVNALKNKK
jgi:hypothetical protein